MPRSLICRYVVVDASRCSTGRGPVEMSARATRFAEAAVAARTSSRCVLHGDATREPVIETGRTRARKPCRRWPDLDAFVCFNDSVAVGAMKHVQAAGLDVPRDFSHRRH